ncbi:putative non-specific serine/threonine protein kinase [Helianthus debilis subsp. tardiflorus]
MVIKILSGQHIPGQFKDIIAQLTNMGDFCINDTTSGSILWESVDYPGNSLLPGMKLGTKGNTQGKHLMSSWTSNSDPTPGKFVAGQPPQVFTWYYCWLEPL